MRGWLMAVGVAGVCAATSLVGACGTPTTTVQKPEAVPRPKGRKAEVMPAAPTADPNRPKPQGKPNVLILVMDTVRADHLSVYGYGRPTSPRLEALGKESAVFERVVSPAMWTLPSHASLFTGLPETTHGATAAHHWLDKRFPTMAEAFLDAGWSTWLFAANPYLQDHTNLGQGFDKREFPVDDRWKKKAKDATMAKVLPDDASNSLGPKFKAGKFPSGRSADRTKDAAPVASEALMTWLDERPDQDRPFFALINYMEAHVPRVPSLTSRKAMFSDEQIASQMTFDQSFGVLLAYTVGMHEFKPEEIELVGQVYDAALRDLDAAIGDLLDQLRARGVLDDTIVVITADHGEHLGDHHRADHKFSTYDALIHVPLIIRYPNAIPPERVSQVVSNLGVFATLAELTGVPLPPGTLSQSLLHPDKLPAEAYSELVEPTRQVFERMTKVDPKFDPSPYELKYQSVTTSNLKCIERSDGRRELFDLAVDPGEERDLAPARGEEAAALCARARQWKEALVAYDPSKADKSEGPGAVDKETRCRLVDLGYMADDPQDPCGVPRGKNKAGTAEEQP